MIRKLIDHEKIDRNQAMYIRQLQARGKLRKHIVGDRKYAAFDTEEFAQFQASVKRGRPVKLGDGDNGENQN